HLRHGEVGDVVVDGAAEKDDALLQETGIDVVCSFAPIRLLDHDGDESAHDDAPSSCASFSGSTRSSVTSAFSIRKSMVFSTSMASRNRRRSRSLRPPPSPP